MFRIRKMYINWFYHDIEKGLMIISALFLAATFFLLKADQVELSYISAALLITLLFYEVTLTIQKFAFGYEITDNSTFYREYVKKKKIQFSDVDYVIISNAFINNGGRPKPINMRKKLSGKRIPCPWITLIIDKKGTARQQMLGDKEHQGILMSTHVKKLYGNLYEHYGFIWNRKEMHKLLKAYRNEYYIAKSVMENFYEEYLMICKLYEIEPDKIHVIEDI